MKRVLSVDLGSRNLSWCVLLKKATLDSKWSCAPFHSQEIEVVAWRNVDITVESGVGEVNLNKTDIAQCVPWFITTVRKYFDEMTLGVDYAVLEAQPTSRMVTGGKCISNVKTKVLAHILQALLYDKNIPVYFASPSLKLKDAEMLDASDYREHKKASCVITERAALLVGGFCLETWSAKKGKKDDMADSFLQGIYYKEKKKVQKRKREPIVIEIPFPDV
jgi:hypothetical protein